MGVPFVTRLASARRDELTCPNHPYQEGALGLIKALCNQPMR